MPLAPFLSETLALAVLIGHDVLSVLPNESVEGALLALPQSLRRVHPPRWTAPTAIVLLPL
jgi:hypothetical protein